MKKLSLFIIASLYAFLSYAQDCSGYFPTTVDTKTELTTYDKKNKQTGKTVQTVTKNETTNAGLKIGLQSEVYDKKDKLLTTLDFDVECKNNNFYIDMKSILSQDQLKAFENMEIEIESSVLNFPNELSVGQKLDDGKTVIKIKSGGTIIMTMTVTITNRTVDSKETITTTAGTFDCFVITEDTKIDMGMMKVNTNSKNWIAKDIGTVKLENYSSKDGYLGKTELTALTR